MLQQLLIQRHSDPVFVGGAGGRKKAARVTSCLAWVAARALRSANFASAPRSGRLATNRGRGQRQGEVAAVQLVKHADAEPAAGLPERKLVPTQQKR